MVIKPESPEKLIHMLQSAPLVLYGMGGAGLRIANWCDKNKVNYIFADKNANIKQKETEKVIVFPNELNEKYPKANIVISSIIYYDEIAKELLNMGIDKERIYSYKLFMPKDILWSDLDGNIDWDLMRFRVEMFSEWITGDIKSVIDYGAGKMFLKDYLNTGVEYYPIDYIKRSEQTILCDLNLGDFPEIQADVTICSGVLEFIFTAEKLLAHVCDHTRKFVILSYVTSDKFPDINGRRISAYVSDLNEKQILDCMMEKHFYLEKCLPDPLNSVCNVYLFRQRDEI